MFNWLRRWFPAAIEKTETESYCPQWSFCETEAAGSLSLYHIRPLTESGSKLGGGADTPSLCGKKVSWDVAAELNSYCLERFTCPACRNVYLSQISWAGTAEYQQLGPMVVAGCLPLVYGDGEVPPDWDVMCLQDFRGQVADGSLTDYDGFGHPYRDGRMASWVVRPSTMYVPKDATHVVWFNR